MFKVQDVTYFGSNMYMMFMYLRLYQHEGELFFIKFIKFYCGKLYNKFDQSVILSWEFSFRFFFLSNNWSKISQADKNDFKLFLIFLSST